jgi:hypothetical protein
MTKDKTESAIAILRMMEEVDEDKYIDLVQDRLGVGLLSLFDEYCRGLVYGEEEPEKASEETEEMIDTMIHLLVLGYLIRDSESEQQILTS